MSAAEEPKHDALGTSLRELRPDVPKTGSLERRLAIASILAASGTRRERPRLGRLELEARLGGGGMGVVYRAFDPDLGRLVAVKLLRGSMQREQRQLIAAEARALAQLSHPNVVTVHEIVDRDDELYFVMEYVAGATLRTWLDTHPNAGWREVLAHFAQAGRGLAAAHDKGIVHRDFKPENVLLGEDGRVRVADFGLARVEVSGESDVAGGTLHYMAPEVRAGRPGTPASDQYGFSRALLDALRGKDAPRPVLDAAERGVREDAAERHPHLTALVELIDGALRAGAHRSRTLLLERVERLWLNGVLDRSVGESGAAPLALESAPELVDTPWETWGVDGGPHGLASSRDLERILEESHNSLLLVGPPGSGKTTLLLLLCRSLFRAASLNVDAPVPVVLSLSTYQPERRAGHSLGSHFAAWIVDELVAKYGMPRPSVRQWLDEAGIAVLLDGLDETDPALRDTVIDALNVFRTEHPVPIVVTCRDSEYEASSARLSFGGAARVLPLDDESIMRLARARHATHLEAQLERDDELREMLKNPLLLTLYASSERDAGGADVEHGAGTPAWARAYERYVDRCFAESEARERRELETQLHFLARTMRRLNVSDLWIERLDFGWFERRADRIVGYAIGVIAVLCFGVGLNLSQVWVTGDPLPSALTFGIGVSVASFAYTRGRIKPVDRLRWSWRRMFRLLPVTTVCATLVGLAEALRVNFAANIVGAAITGAILAVTFALESGNRAMRLRPNAGIRRSIELALGVSLGFGVPVGLAFAFVINPYITRPLIVVVEHHGNPSLVIGVAVGLFVFTALFLVYGGFTAIMHGVLRAWLALRTPLPLDLLRMLDRAADLGLMRRVGGGYVFLHRTLLDYFAELSTRADVR